MEFLTLDIFAYKGRPHFIKLFSMKDKHQYINYTREKEFSVSVLWLESTKTLYKYVHDMLEVKDTRCIHQGRYKRERERERERERKREIYRNRERTRERKRERYK